MDPGLRASGLLAGYELDETERSNGQTNSGIDPTALTVRTCYLTHQGVEEQLSGRKGFCHRFRITACLMVGQSAQTHLNNFFLYFLGFCVFILCSSIHDQ